MYRALEHIGCVGGNVLEPSMGVGAFFGHRHSKFDTHNAKLYGVELDSLSGRIAQQLYQKAKIQITGYEKADLPDNFFDLAIGNVPFGQYQVGDRRYDKLHFQIHDYFSADGAAYQREIFIAQVNVKLSDALYCKPLVVFKVNGAAHFAYRFLVRDGWQQGLRFCLPVYPCRHLLAFCIRQVAVHSDKIFQPLADLFPFELFLIPQVILEIVKDA